MQDSLFFLIGLHEKNDAVAVYPLSPPPFFRRHSVAVDRMRLKRRLYCASTTDVVVPLKPQTQAVVSPQNEKLGTHLPLSGQRLAFGQCVLLSGSAPPKSFALPRRSGYLLAPYFPIKVCMLVDALKEGKNDVMDEKHTLQDTTHGSLTLIAPVWS